MTALSVIVACADAEATVGECLRAFRAQAAGHRVEIVAVGPAGDASMRVAERTGPGVRLVKVDGPLLVPELWARGAEQATGDIIAFTTAHFVPDAQWLSETLDQHASDYAGIGGAIENRQPSSLTQWAVYFARYAAYMEPFAPREVDQVPGDNASYKRWVLDEYGPLVRSGFWETVINRQLRRDGHRLLLTPAVRLWHGSSVGVRAFCRQRVVHGRAFGLERVATISPAARAFYIALVPLVPAIFLGRIAREVAARRRHLAPFVLSLPLLVLFLVCWSVGELRGYLKGEAPAWQGTHGSSGHRATRSPG